MSSTIVDDTDSRFDYKDDAWTAGGQSGEFNSTSHSTDTAGAQVIFGPFTGTSIAVFSTVGTSQPKIHFFVDDDIQNTDLPAETSSSVKFQQQVYSARNLNSTAQHTLQINVLDPGPFTLDFVIIGNGTSSSANSSRTSIGSASTSVTGVVTSITIFLPATTTPLTTSSLVTASSTSALTPSDPQSGLITTTLPVVGVQSGVSASNSADPSSIMSSVPMEAPKSGLDATVIGSVTGAIVFLAVVVVSLVLFLRWRRRTQPDRSASNNRSIAFGAPSDPWPKSRTRPSLRLSIPSAMSISRSAHKPPSLLLPIHNPKSSASSLNPSAVFNSARPRSFLEEDPNESPVFDIKQRPVSGSTMTTRVTVGTSIGQRVSVPDFAYRYPYAETPVPVPVHALPDLHTLSMRKGASPTETETMSSATGEGTHATHRLGMPTAAFDTSVFPSTTERWMAGSGFSAMAPRPLPYPPSDAKHAHLDIDAHARSNGRRMQAHTAQSPLQSHRLMPSTPNSFASDESAEIVLHQTSGVRLAAATPAGQTAVRRGLPPPYQDHRF